MASVGTITVDFGSSYVDNGAFTITDAGILATSYVEVFVMVDSTADNDATQHQIAATSLRLSALPASGSATVYADALFGLVKGTFKLRYVYS